MGQEEGGGGSKKTSFFFHKNLHLPQPGQSCSQLQLQEQAGLLSPRAWFAFPGPFPCSCSPSQSCTPDECSCGTAIALPLPEFRNQRPFQPPALLERPRWIQRALDGSPQPLHGYKRGLWAAFIQIMKTKLQTPSSCLLTSCRNSMHQGRAKQISVCAQHQPPSQNNASPD